MIYQHQEPIRGKPDLIRDGKSWCFAPSGHIRPFDRIIRVVVLKHMEGNQIRVQWANQGAYTLRYDSELTEQIKSWAVGSKHRVQMWGDRIEAVLPTK